jgi:PAP2 superfamily
MDWPTWDQAAVVAALCAVATIVLRRTRPTRLRTFAISATEELTLMAALYSVWRLARVLPLAQPAGAINRARQIDRLQHTLHMPTELSLQHFVLHHSWLARSVNAYYAVAHVPALIAFLVWLFVRHRDQYSRWRNALAILTAFCVVIRFIRVAPPRFLPDLGYIDLATRYGLSVYGPVGTGVSDQFAAMPSIHVGWAALVSFGIIAVTTSRWRWLFLSHLVLTMLVVSATGNHWWLDGIVAIILLLIAFAIDDGARRFATSRRGRSIPLRADRLAVGAEGTLDSPIARVEDEVFN